MPFDNKAFVGRSIPVFVALTDSQTEPTDLEFQELGAVRGLEYGPEWDTSDTTARGTQDGLSRTGLVTFKNNNLSIDGLVLIDNVVQDNVRDHIENPPTAMNGQPFAWVRVVEPRDGGATQIRSYPVTITSFRVSAPYDDVTTWTLETQGQGDPVITDVPA